MTTQLQNLPVTKEDLPIWMRRAMRGTDWGALLTIGFSVLAAWFFILNTDLPAANMTENYAFMTADYADAILEGRLYPRWAPHALDGYGAPIYHYYPPGAPYLSGFIAALFTGDVLAAVRVTYLIGFMLAGVGTYGVVVRHRGAPAAILAAMLYVTSPYIGLTAPHILGDLPGVLALGILPVFLWSVDRLVSANYPQDFAFVTVTTAALLLTDPRVALVGGLIAGAMLAWHRTLRRGNPHYVRLVVLAIALGVMMTSFYWLPALVELDFVRWETNIQTSRPIFLTLSGLFVRFQQLDPAALVPDVQLTLGWLRWLVAALAVVGVVWVQRRFTIEALFLSIAGITTALALIVFPAEMWLLGVLTLCLSLSSGAALALRDAFSERVRRLVLALALLAILGASHPAWLPPQPRSTITDVSPAEQVQHEQDGYGVSVVPGDYPYPTTLAPTIQPDGDLLSSYAAGGISRIGRSILSSSLQVIPLAETTHTSRFQVTGSPQPLELLLAYFPGWRARVGRQAVSIAPGDTELAVLALPQTNNQILTVWLGSTPPRSLGWGLSALALLTLLALTRHRYYNAVPQYHDVPLLTLPEVRLISALFIFFALVIFSTAHFDAPISIRVPPGSGLREVTTVDSRSNVGINLLGYDLDRTRFRYGDRMLLTLYWSTLRELPQNYRVQVTLHGPNQMGLSKPVVRYPGGAPPTRWPLNQYVTDPHYIEISPNIPPGEYLISISLRTCDVGPVACPTGEQPTFFESDGGSTGQNYELTQMITIRP